MSEAEKPYDRALRLLISFLDEEQRADLNKFGGFMHRNRDRIYWIPLEGEPTCAFQSRGLLYLYCIHTTDTKIPGPDKALTFLTWIRSAPDKFHAWCNVIRTFPLPRFEDEEELRHYLARGSGVGRGGSPRLTYIATPAPTESQRRLGLTRARALKKELRIELLRDRLALVDLGPQTVIEKLAESWPF